MEDLSRRHRFSKGTFYEWRAKYGGMRIREVKRMKELEEENHRLKQMYANLSLEHNVLKDIIEKTLQVAEKRKLVSYAVQEFGLSERQACRTVQVSRCAYRYRATRTADEPITQELQQLAQLQPRWGCDKMTDEDLSAGYGEILKMRLPNIGVRRRCED